MLILKETPTDEIDYKLKNKETDQQNITGTNANLLSKQDNLRKIVLHGLRENSLKKHNQTYSDQLSSTHIGISHIKQPIYASELLTPKVKRLMFLAKDYARSANYKFVWPSNGRVFMRLAEGKPYFSLRNEADLGDLKKKDSIPK